MQSRTLVAGLGVVLAALIACKKKAPSLDTPPSEEPTAAGDPTAESAGETLFDWDLASVCNEMPQKKATPYAKKVGEIHPTIVFDRSDANSKFEKSYSGDFDGWKSDDAKAYQLVACVTVTSHKKVKECVFDSEKPARYLDLYSATYEFRVHEAATGKELGKKTVELAADKECPMFRMFKQEREAKDPDYEQALMEFAKAFVAPKG